MASSDNHSVTDYEAVLRSATKESATVEENLQAIYTKFISIAGPPKTDDDGNLTCENCRQKFREEDNGSYACTWYSEVHKGLFRTDYNSMHGMDGMRRILQKKVPTGKKIMLAMAVISGRDVDAPQAITENVSARIGTDRRDFHLLQMIGGLKSQQSCRMMSTIMRTVERVGKSCWCRIISANSNILFGRRLESKVNEF